MKRKSFFTPAFFLICIIMGCASAKISSDNLKNVKEMRPPDGKALVYIVRHGSYVGSFINFVITCDDRKIGTLSSKRFIYTVLNPGLHKFVGKAENKSELFLTVEANQIYFIQDKVQMGAAFAENDLVRLRDEEGREELNKCKLSPDCDAYKPTK
jgi:hypothetical protein